MAFKYEGGNKIDVVTDSGEGHSTPSRLTAANARKTPCKLGTVSRQVWIHEDDFPLQKGDTIRYTKHEHGHTTHGRVISDPDTRYLFIGVDPHTPLLED